MIVLGALLPHPPILLPEIAAGRERDVRSTLDAYALIARRVVELEVSRVLMISTHGIVTLGRFHLLDAPLAGNLGRFGAPQVAFARDRDQEMVSLIRSAAEAQGLPVTSTRAWEESDHSIGVPLRLLENSVPAQIGVVSISFLTPQAHYRFGEAIGAALAAIAEPTAILASGDAVHTLTEDSPFRRHPRAAEVQAEFETALAEWDVGRLMAIEEPLRREVDESVVSPTLILMGALDAVSGVTITPRILASEHPWGVGYVTSLVEINDTPVLR